MIKMLYNRCTGIYKFGNNTHPWPIRCRSNLGHIFLGKKCVLWARKYGTSVTCVINFRVTTVSMTVSDFCCTVNKNCALWGFHVAQSGSFLPTFWDNLSAPS